MYFHFVCSCIVVALYSFSLLNEQITSYNYLQRVYSYVLSISWWDQRFRSSGEKKTLKEEAIESLKTITPTPIDAKAPPSPVQALLGGLAAGVIAIILYKFTTTIEATLNRQAISDNFSVCLSFASQICLRCIYSNIHIVMLITATNEYGLLN